MPFRGSQRGGRSFDCARRDQGASNWREVPKKHEPVSAFRDEDCDGWGPGWTGGSNLHEFVQPAVQTTDHTNGRVFIDGPNSSPSQDAPGNTLHVENTVVGRIIGRGGTKIKELERTTGARIDVRKRESNGLTTPVVLRGKDSSVEKAQQMIRQLLGNSTGGARSNEFVMNVDNDYIGRIIGSGGSKIKDIQTESGARVKIQKNDSYGSTTPVVISGSAEARASAQRLIEELTDPMHGITVTTVTTDEVPHAADGFDNPFFTSDAIDWSVVNQRAEEIANERWKDFPSVKKDFYFEDPAVSIMTPEEVNLFREENNRISISAGKDYTGPLPNPVTSFEAAFAHYPEILETIADQGFERPSPIQCQAWPVLLQGTDLIGIAQTGTGKTLAFLLPAMIHLDGQTLPRRERKGPSVVILSPTRELALQIQSEVDKYSYKNITCLCVYGGGSRREQVTHIRKGVDIVVATPGRLIDLVDAGELSLLYVTFVVLDEADRMLDLGFEPQIMRILKRIRPDRQTAMTSATWPWEVEDLASRYMKMPIHVNVGSFDLTAVHTVTQLVEFLEEDEKRDRLNFFLSEELQPHEKALVFMKRKTTVDDVVCDYAVKGIHIQSMHGGRDQLDREQALLDLRNGETNVLVATDLAARGIDIPDVTHVFNYDFPLDIEEYVHRIGRTGRAGRSGIAISLLTHQDWSKSPDLIKIMEEANQEVPDELYDMAERFRRRQERDEREGRTRRGRGGRRRWGRRD